MRMLMQQNVMVGTIQGDIYYVRNGRVPMRPSGYNADWNKPVPGNTSASEWRDIHPFDDLLSMTNPWQGYMQNCNVSPEFITRFCPLTPERYKAQSYLYNEDNPLHQRAATVLRILDGNGRMTLADAFDLTVCPDVYNVERWQARLEKSRNSLGAVQQPDDWMTFFNEIVRWNRRADADSTGAVAYKFWKDQLWKDKKVLDADRAGATPPEIPDDKLLAAVAAGAAELKKQWGRLDVKYGDIYRVGRAGTGRTWPVSGGSIKGLATPRAISFDDKPEKDGRTFLGHGGQTSTQVVQLTNPPRSWTYLPLGESDHADSKHFDDQCEKLFAPGKLKPTYFLDKDELLKHVESKKVLHRSVQVAGQ
jgi:acyl-homoserine-lactone acylase